MGDRCVGAWGDTHSVGKQYPGYGGHHIQLEVTHPGTDTPHPVIWGTHLGVGFSIGQRAPQVWGAPLTPHSPAEAEVGQVQEFQVETQGAGGQGQLEVKVTGPSRRPVPCTVGPAPPGGPHPVSFTPPEEGPHRVEVTYDGHPVPGSPFPVEALLPPDPSKVSMAHVCATGMCVPTPVCPSALLTPACLSQAPHVPMTP